MPPITIHIINHTHWDREWFLTSIYTSHWIPGLIDKLEELVANNPKFKFLLDGQTLVIEDLLEVSPKHKVKIKQLIEKGNLSIGPYYCQPDWQLTGGETLIRNLLYGHQDMVQHGGNVDVGWLVDTFGHISQSPQLHRLFGIETVFVWRGVPRLLPYFHWQGPDNKQLFTINLFGGYRNLYGITHVPEVAIDRLQTEVNKLAPFYPTPDLPLFDGYDLEDNPEDPISFFEGKSEIPPEFQLCESSPQDFSLQIKLKLDSIPIIFGELNSGKYGATFPGTLSTRNYLKVMKRDCEQLLYRVCEPLGVLARLKGRPYPAVKYDKLGRKLLKNAVHDCICGVSIDQVHEKMEYTYHEVFEAACADLRDSLGFILQDFTVGIYAVSTNPFLYEGWHFIEDKLYHIQTRGIGVWPIESSIPIRRQNTPIEKFVWKNDHYTVEVPEDGTIHIGESTLGLLMITTENGDTYSDEAGDPLGIFRPVKMYVEQNSERHCIFQIALSYSRENINVSVNARVIFDQSPLIRWELELDSRGGDFRVEMIFKTRHLGQVYAGTPFDTVERSTVDIDLLPCKLEKKLENVLLGQREIGAVRTFPFQDFVAITNEDSTVAILTKGLHAYQADESGNITIPLRRSIEWLTKSDLEYRVGDAGPFFYVPDARCERKVTHELAVFFTNYGVDDHRFYSLIAGYQNPPLIVGTSGTGSITKWTYLQENLPLSSLHLRNKSILARFYNPTSRTLPLSKDYIKSDVFGNPEKTIKAAAAKSILTLSLNESLPDISKVKTKAVNWLNHPIKRVGSNQGRPNPQIIKQLKEKITQIKNQISEIYALYNDTDSQNRYILQHKAYILERELLEYSLSVRLNEIKLTQSQNLQYDNLYRSDEMVAKIGWQLNQIRIKRRIYDYIIKTI